MEKKPHTGEIMGNLPKETPKASKRNTNTDENIERVYEEEEELLKKDPDYIEDEELEEERR